MKLSVKLSSMSFFFLSLALFVIPSNAEVTSQWQEASLSRSAEVDLEGYSGVWKGEQTNEDIIVVRLEGELVKVSGTNNYGHWEMICVLYGNSNILKCTGYSITGGETIYLIESELKLQGPDKLIENWNIYDPDQIYDKAVSKRHTSVYRRIDKPTNTEHGTR